MHLIVCVEDNGGLSFCGRRLSFDRVVTAEILRIASENKLWMNRYSSGLFTDQNVMVDEYFLQRAGKGEYCFLENIPVPDSLENIESIIVFRWNRRYPATVKFPIELLADRELVETVEFTGFSHKTITMERYQ